MDLFGFWYNSFVFWILHDLLYFLSDYTIKIRQTPCYYWGFRFLVHFLPFSGNKQKHLKNNNTLVSMLSLYTQSEVVWV